MIMILIEIAHILNKLGWKVKYRDEIKKGDYEPLVIIVNGILIPYNLQGIDIEYKSKEMICIDIAQKVMRFILR